MAKTLALIDYGSGNLRSVSKALERVGASIRLANSAEALADADGLVLPGVGAFGDCVRNLVQRGLLQPIRSWINEDKPFLGICLGYQMLFESSDESPGVDGLGIFKGKVVRFADRPGMKVPHMGWNQLEFPSGNPAWKGLAQGGYVYFVHSYYPDPVDQTLVSAWCDYGGRFAAAITRGRLLATQFHPEKSQDAGLQILSNFVELI